MRIDDIHVIQLQTIQRDMDAFDNMLARKAMVVDEDLAVGRAPIELCDAC